MIDAGIEIKMDHGVALRFVEALESLTKQTPLTPKQIQKLCEEYGFAYMNAQGEITLDFIRAIENMHGIGDEGK